MLASFAFRFTVAIIAVGGAALVAYHLGRARAIDELRAADAIEQGLRALSTLTVVERMLAELDASATYLVQRETVRLIRYEPGINAPGSWDGVW